MLAQNISLCGNLFVFFFSSFDFNREQNFLSSIEPVNAAGVGHASSCHQSAVSRQLKLMLTCSTSFLGVLSQKFVT